MLVVIGGLCQPFVLHIQGPRDVDVGFGCSQVFVINFFLFSLFFFFKPQPAESGAEEPGL